MGKPTRSALLIVASLLASSCGDNADPGPQIVATTELPLLASPDPAVVFNHSREVTVAAANGRVVVAAVHEQFLRDDSYEPGPDFQKQVAVNVSTDGGLSFGPAIEPGHGPESSDPVVRVSAAGFFLATCCQGVISRTQDGIGWTVLARDIVVGDKEWMAVDDERQQVFIVGRDGYHRYDFAGTLLASAAGTRHLTSDAYVDAAGMHVATGVSPGGVLGGQVFTHEVLQWDGQTQPVQEIAPLDPGNSATEFTTLSWSRGPLPAGTWSVLSRRDDDRGRIVVRVEGAELSEFDLTDPSVSNTFLPAATLDERGRLHVVWYDSAPERGVLRYTHSRGKAPFSDGFIDPTTVDEDAVPGDGWYPSFDTPSGGRRLREYIGIAVDGDRVHIAWTHAPQPPSRVHAATIIVHD